MFIVNAYVFLIVYYPVIVYVLYSVALGDVHLVILTVEPFVNFIVDTPGLY